MLFGFGCAAWTGWLLNICDFVFTPIFNSVSKILAEIKYNTKNYTKTLYI